MDGEAAGDAAAFSQRTGETFAELARSTAGIKAIRAMLARDGTLHSRALGDGAEVARSDLRVLPAGGVLPVGGDLAVPVGRGVLQPLAIERLAPVKKP